MKKKIIAMITGLAIVAMIAPSSATAITAAELQVQIDALIAQLATLQSQLADLTGEPAGTVTGCTITSFARNLKVGMTGDDVKCLQIVLNTASDTQLSAGVGSPGQETSYFGPKTKAAVIKFQEKYTADVLAVYGLTAGTGYVGTTTRAKLNTLLAAGEQEEEEEEEEEEEIASGLKASLRSDTPVAASVATGANANFTKFTLTAGTEGSVKISKIYVTRSGLSANSDVENIKIVDVETGEYKGSIGSLNVDNRAMITFVPKLVISAGTTREFYIRAGVISTATAGKTVLLGIAANSDIVSDASDVTGASVTGNAMTIVSLTIGSLAVSEDGTTIDSKPDTGDTGVIVLKWKAAAGSTEPVTIETITVKRTGTADASDTENIELYDVTNNKSLGTVDNWSAEDKATWSNLDLKVGKGETQRFRILVDVVGGVSATPQTVNVDLVDGSDCLVTVKGDTYGFYITPSSPAANWSTTALRGKATNDQTIQSGSLNISKSTTTPATGNIAAGDDVVLGVFDFDVKGEEIKVTDIRLDFTLGTMTYGQVTNVSIYDEDGTIVTGPKDLTSSSSAPVGGYASFTDTFIAPIGIHQYTVKAKIADAVSSSDTILAIIDRPGTSITATGMTSNDSITATPAGDVSANTLTVAAGALSVVTLDTPAARSVAVGTINFVWATASLDAGSSGEDALVSTVTITDTLAAASDAADYIDNAEIWADLTSENSARGDVYETKISNTEQPDDTDTDTTTAETHAFTLTQTITVAKGSFVKIAFIASLNASADTSGDTHTITFSAVTATGSETGSDIGESVSGSGQTMSNAQKGTLTVTLHSSTPDPDIILEGEIVTLAVFKLAANNIEDLDVDKIIVNVSEGNSMATIYLYDGNDTLLASAAGANRTLFVLADGTLTVPANGYVKLKVKVKPLDVDGSVVVSGISVRARLVETDNIQTTGLSSGSSVNSSTGKDGKEMKYYESRPYFTLSASNPSGSTLTTNQNFLAAVFDVRAANGGAITFEDDDSSTIKLSLSIVQNDTNATSRTFTLKDEIGTTLDTATINTNGANKMSDYSDITFDFGAGAGDSGAAFSVSAGQTKKLYVYVDTRGLGEAGDTLQVYLDDTAANINWGIDADNEAAGPTNYYGFTDGNIIFRGDVLGTTWVTPTGMTD